MRKTRKWNELMRRCRRVFPLAQPPTSICRPHTSYVLYTILCEAQKLSEKHEMLCSGDRNASLRCPGYGDRRHARRVCSSLHCRDFWLVGSTLPTYPPLSCLKHAVRNLLPLSKMRMENNIDLALYDMVLPLYKSPSDARGVTIWSGASSLPLFTELGNFTALRSLRVLLPVVLCVLHEKNVRKCSSSYNTENTTRYPRFFAEKDYCTSK